jgi:hypothetical protein
LATRKSREDFRPQGNGAEIKHSLYNRAILVLSQVKHSLRNCAILEKSVFWCVSLICTNLFFLREGGNFPVRFFSECEL